MNSRSKDRVYHLHWKESDKLQIKGQGILILIYEQKAQVKG